MVGRHDIAQTKVVAAVQFQDHFAPVADAYRVSLLVNSMGDELARRWIRSARCSGDPAVDDSELQRLARIFSIMCTAVLDPESLGIDELAISAVMEGMTADGYDD